MRQQKFKRGKEKMLSIAQESGDGQSLLQPEDDDDDDDDDGMRETSRLKTRLHDWQCSRSLEVILHELNLVEVVLLCV